MRHGPCNGTVSVHPSVCPVYQPLQPRAASLLLWVRRRRYRSIAARPANACEQCHVYSRRRRLNTDLFYLHRVAKTAVWYPATFYSSISSYSSYSSSSFFSFLRLITRQLSEVQWQHVSDVADRFTVLYYSTLLQDSVYQKIFTSVDFDRVIPKSDLGVFESWCVLCSCRWLAGFFVITC